MKALFTLPLNETTEAIFERYVQLKEELETLMPEDFEGKSQIYGEMQGIKFVVDLLSKTKFF